MLPPCIKNEQQDADDNLPRLGGNLSGSKARGAGELLLLSPGRQLALHDKLLELLPIYVSMVIQARRFTEALRHGRRTPRIGQTLAHGAKVLLKLWPMPIFLPMARGGTIRNGRDQELSLKQKRMPKKRFGGVAQDFY